jgi:hypothetical protein
MALVSASVSAHFMPKSQSSQPVTSGSKFDTTNLHVEYLQRTPHGLLVLYAVRREVASL